MNANDSNPSPDLRGPVRFTNRFGSVSLTPVSDFMPVGRITKNHPVAQAHAFDMDAAEKIALITGNRGIQICVHYPLDGLAYVVLHDSPSSASICKVDIDAFDCPVPAARMINDLNRQASRAL